MQNEPDSGGWIIASVMRTARSPQCVTLQEEELAQANQHVAPSYRQLARARRREPRDDLGGNEPFTERRDPKGTCHGSFHPEGRTQGRENFGSGRERRASRSRIRRLIGRPRDCASVNNA